MGCGHSPQSKSQVSGLSLIRRGVGDAEELGSLWDCLLVVNTEP